MRAVNHRVFAVVSLCLGLCTCALAQGVPEAPAVAAPLTRPALVAQDTVNAAHTGWMMTSTALVLLMTLPGIALFYAGMVRRKNVLNTMASPARPSAATAEPALKPNQPTHSMPAPAMVSPRL